MNRIEFNRQELLKSIDVLMSAPSFALAWEMLSCGAKIDILFSRGSRQAFFLSGSEDSLTKYLELDCVYVASIIFSKDHELLSESECRLYMRQNLVMLVSQHHYLPYGLDGKFKRVYL